DDAPEEIAARRHAGFMRLAEQYRTRFAETLRQTGDVADGLSDLQFTEAYRVPFQFGRLVRQHLRAGAFVRSSDGTTLTDLDGNRFYDLTGSYGVNLFGYDFYKDCMERGHRLGRDRRARLGPCPPGGAGKGRRPDEISRP